MEPVERAEGDPGPDGKGEGRSLGRFLKMEELSQQGLKGGHGRLCFTSSGRAEMLIAGDR